MMMFFLRLFAPSPVGFGTPITTLFVGRLIKVDVDEPMDDDDDTDANKVAAHNPRIFLTCEDDLLLFYSSSSSSLCWEKEKKKG